MSTCRFNRMVEWKKQCKDQKDQRRWNQTVASLVHAVWATLYSWPLLAMYAFNKEKNSERYECPSAWGCPTSTDTVTDSVTISADVNDTPSTAQRAWNESATSSMVLYHDGNCDPGGGEEWFAASFCGYILIDLIIDLSETVITKRRSLEPDALAHHSIFLCVFMLNYFTKRWCFM